MAAKTGELKAWWSKRENDLMLETGDGCERSDRRILCSAFDTAKNALGTTLLQELESRGYDLTTIRFRVKKKAR